MIKDKNGFVLEYGNGKAIRRLSEQMWYINTGNVRLIIDGGETVEFNHCGDSREAKIIHEYGDYGVKDVISKYSCTEIVISKLFDE